MSAMSSSFLDLLVNVSRIVDPHLRMYHTHVCCVCVHELYGLYCLRKPGVYRDSIFRLNGYTQNCPDSSCSSWTPIIVYISVDPDYFLKRQRRLVSHRVNICQSSCVILNLLLFSNNFPFIESHLRLSFCATAIVQPLTIPFRPSLFDWRIVL